MRTADITPGFYEVRLGTRPHVFREVVRVTGVERAFPEFPSNRTMVAVFDRILANGIRSDCRTNVRDVIRRIDLPAEIAKHERLVRLVENDWKDEA